MDSKSCFQDPENQEFYDSELLPAFHLDVWKPLIDGKIA
jgi:hypothetical protein